MGPTTDIGTTGRYASQPARTRINIPFATLLQPARKLSKKIVSRMSAAMISPPEIGRVCYYLGMGMVPALAGFARHTRNPAAPIYVAGAMLVLAGGALLLFCALQIGNAAPESAG